MARLLSGCCRTCAPRPCERRVSLQPWRARAEHAVTSFAGIDSRWVDLPPANCSGVDTLLLRMEDLFDPANSARSLATASQLLSFVGLRADRRRLQCAYRHAERYRRLGSLTLHDAYCVHMTAAGRRELATQAGPELAAAGYAPLRCTVARLFAKVYNRSATRHFANRTVVRKKLIASSGGVGQSAGPH